MADQSNIAMLIDADNSPASRIEEVLDELAKYGVINIRRAYGNWKSPSLKGWEAVLHDYAIRPIQQFAYSKGKNATDMAMCVDAMDLLYSNALDGICLVSSDADFTPLVMRIRANGLIVIGFGEKKTPTPFVNACSKFLYLETLADIEPGDSSIATSSESSGDSQAKAVAPPPPVTPSPRQDGKILRGDTRLTNLLRKAVEAAADDDGWAALGGVGSHIAKQASFDPRNYGYAKLKDLFVAVGLFDMREVNKAVYVRDKKHQTANSK